MKLFFFKSIKCIEQSSSILLMRLKIDIRENLFLKINIVFTDDYFLTIHFQI